MSKQHPYRNYNIKFLRNLHLGDHLGDQCDHLAHHLTDHPQLLPDHLAHQMIMIGHLGYNLA